VRIDGKGNKAWAEVPKNGTWEEEIECEIQGEAQELARYMEQATIIIMCDGSVKENEAGAGWVISTETAFGKGAYIRGWGKIQENKCTPYRAECYGIYGGLLTWEKFKRTWKIQNNTIMITGDNQKSLKQVERDKHSKGSNSKTAEYDIIEAIRQLTKSTDFYCQHTKGHQDTSEDSSNTLTVMN
jgi:ribonuclease HI